MVESITELINNKRVLILGYGAEGRSTYRLLSDLGSCTALDIADSNPGGDLPDCRIHAGADYLACLEDYDIIIKSPGVAWPGTLPPPGTGKDSGPIITAQTEQFLRHYKKQSIGITGTKGKSTVASLLYHVLKTKGIPCLLAGNIGLPVFDIIADIRPEVAIILELSCHQLEHCAHSPATAAFLNIHEDHLDRYATFEEYFRAKKNIYLHQGPQDRLYCNTDTKPAAEMAAAQTIMVDGEILPFAALADIAGCRLRGAHNRENVAFVYAIARNFAISDADFVAALKTYKPLPHRLEYIGEREGVEYYDDSISTTAQSAINAVESITNAATVLLGGMDRGIDYLPLVEYLANSRLSHIICMYESGKRLYGMLEGREGLVPSLNYCDDLAAATQLAMRLTPPGFACILSPAAASYGDFKDFAARGDAFRRLVFSFPR